MPVTPTPSSPSGTPAQPATSASAPSSSAEASRRRRSLWRVHCYAGVCAMPFVLLMAVSGLVILYTQPIQTATQGHLRRVPLSTTQVSFDVQARAAATAVPQAKMTALTPPADARSATIFAVDDGSANGRQVFVDPHTGKVLGSVKTGAGVVGLANRLHGFLNNNHVTVSLPSLAALWDHGAWMRKYIVGDLVLEAFGVWTLVLVLSGLYLWWPRRSPAGSERRNGRGLLRVRFSKRGRARWRDLHGLSGVLLLGAMLVTIVSGMAWSTYWGPNFTALANRISPNVWTDAPPSILGTRGDVDRFGNKVAWNTGSAPVPASYATKPDGTLPAPLSLDDVVRAAQAEHLKPGYTITFPTNTSDAKTGATVFGTFSLANSWPRRTDEARTLYLDQFTGKRLGDVSAYGYGTVSYALDTLVSTHMGTQLGLPDRIVMTALCLLAIWSVISASLMYTKRRRPGTLGLPRRPVDVRLAQRLSVTAWLLGIVYPVWGVTAAVVLGLDRIVVRRRRRLRVAFGQR